MSKVILVMLLGAASAQAGLSKLDALGMIESGNNDAAVGSRGEVSRFQIKPNIWREYSSTRSWRDVRVSTTVAQDYLAHLEDTFRKRARREPTDFDLYVLWNAGPSYYAKVSFSAARVHPVIRERALRYVNLRSMNNAITVFAKPATAAPALTPARSEPGSPPLAQAISTAPATVDAPVMAAVMPGLSTISTGPQSIPAGRGQSGMLGGGIRGR